MTQLSRKYLHQRKDPRPSKTFQAAHCEASGLSQLCNGSSLPPGLGELAVAQHALGGVGLALLRQQRTGQGQMVQAASGLGLRGLGVENCENGGNGLEAGLFGCK